MTTAPDKTENKKDCIQATTIRVISINLEGTLPISDEYRTALTHHLSKEITPYRPDFILTQERPIALLGYKGDDFPHSGYGDHVLYRQDLKLIRKGTDRYGTIGVFDINGKEVTVISGRWDPGTNLGAQRAQRFNALMERKDQYLIWGGDTNMRGNEGYTQKTSLVDVGAMWKYEHKDSGNDASSFTVDAYDNAYFRDQYQYRARYDRFYRSRNIATVDYQVILTKKFPDLVGTSNRSGCLSDHYGIYGEFLLT